GRVVRGARIVDQVRGGGRRGRGEKGRGQGGCQGHGAGHETAPSRNPRNQSRPTSVFESVFERITSSSSESGTLTISIRSTSSVWACSSYRSVARYTWISRSLKPGDAQKVVTCPQDFAPLPISSASSRL